MIRALAALMVFLALSPVAATQAPPEEAPPPRPAPQAEPELVLPPPHAGPALGQLPLLPPHAHHHFPQHGMLSVWKLYGVNPMGYWRPVVIYPPSGHAYYRSNGAPYPSATTRPSAWMPYVVD
jgi:hypothetical protein